jgi:rhodanese-related sulfurtransferase
MASLVGLKAFRRLPAMLQRHTGSLRQKSIASPQEIQAVMKAATVVDIRSTEERLTSSVCEKALHLEWDREEEEMKVYGLPDDKSLPIILYCRTGARTRPAAGFLEYHYGYTNVLNGGGIQTPKQWAVLSGASEAFSGASEAFA